MNSVLTNSGAMTALQVLNATNKALTETQGRIATGLKVATADQNAAIFAMSGVMRSDVAGYQTINESLGLAESAVSVGRSGAENISELLKEMKTKIISGVDGNIDRQKLQTDINELKGQIETISSSATFNGINYLAGEQSETILSSLNRSTTDGASYTVTTSEISFQRQNLVLGTASPNAITVDTSGTEQKDAVGSVIEITLSGIPDPAALGTLDLKIGGQLLSTTPDSGGVTGAIDFAAGTHGEAAPADLDLANIVTELNTAFDTIYGASVVVASVSTDGNKLVITDTLGRGISDLAWTPTTGSATGVEAIGGSVEQIAVESKTSFTFNSLNTQDNQGLLVNADWDPLDKNTVLQFDYRFSRVVLSQNDGTEIDVTEDNPAGDTTAQTNWEAVRDSKTMTDFATNLQTALRYLDDADNDGTLGEDTNYTVTWDQTTGKLSIEDAAGRGVKARFEGAGTGKLGALSTLDVTTDHGVNTALDDIETMIQSSLDSAAALGSTQKRMSIQRDFLTKLVDALDTGIGTLVDANMTAESARLQSLQVQQQLGTQALSIANQQPQNILSLFR